jgi:hypothetical protein
MTDIAESKPWCYDRLLDSVRKDWDEHDKTCESMAWFWLGYRGGVSCPSDITTCHQCGVAFYNEGVVCVNEDDTEAEEWDYRCECCRRPPQTCQTPGVASSSHPQNAQHASVAATSGP